MCAAPQEVPLRACDNIRIPAPQTGCMVTRLSLLSVCAGLLLVGNLGCLAQRARADDSSSQDGSNSTLTPSAQSASTPPKQNARPVLTAEDQRKKQIADESTQLLSMALALKAEVDKTNKDVLSINVIRKADEIEKLAHTVKEKIKQSAGPE